MSTNDVDPHALVAEFQKAFKTPATPEFWEGLIREEAEEVQEALANLLKELLDLTYVVCGYTNVAGSPAPKDLVNATGPLLSLADIMFDEKVQEEAFLRVHQSNMSKLGPDGNPLYREDGKVLKGPHYKPPVLGDLVRYL